MENALQALHLECDRLHAEITRTLLTEDGIDRALLRVATENNFVAALDVGGIEQKVQLSEGKYRSTFEDAAIGMALTGTDCRFLSVNRALSKMLGYTTAELTTMTWLEVTHPADRKRCQKWSDEILSGAVHDPRLEKRYIDRDGRIVWIQVSKALHLDENNAPLYFIDQVQDITELKSLGNQLRHAQKMEALGTLSGGIAHNFNTILTIIVGYASFIEMNLIKDDPLQPYVDQILSAADRGALLTKSLLTFGRKQEFVPQLVDLNNLLPDAKTLLLQLLREDIVVQTKLADSPCMVMADMSQIELVLMNLTTNARDAMPQGGTLAFTTSTSNIDLDFIAAHGYGVPGPYVLLTVTDNGSGMGSKTMNRIFEPFFTTKGVGKGIGLGLSMAYGIVKQHHGFINCYSEEGEGTIMRIYLPAVDLPVMPGREEG